MLFSVAATTIGRLLVSDAHPLVAGPVEVLERRAAVVAARETVLDPLLEAGAHHAVAQAAVAVEAARQRQSLLATRGSQRWVARLPSRSVASP